jgi:hypothetical protein
MWHCEKSRAMIFSPGRENRQNKIIKELFQVEKKGKKSRARLFRRAGHFGHHPLAERKLSLRGHRHVR